MKKRTNIAAAVVAVAAIGLALPSTVASAAGGGGESLCSASSGEINLGVLVVELQRLVGYDGDKNPGNPSPFMPQNAQWCNPHYGH